MEKGVKVSESVKTKLTAKEISLKCRQRDEEFFKLRGEGLSYAKIAMRLGVSQTAALQRVNRYLNRQNRFAVCLKKWGVAEISRRLENILSGKRITNKGEALEAYKEGRFVWKGKHGIRNYGKKAHQELLRIIGVEEPDLEVEKDGQ